MKQLGAMLALALGSFAVAACGEDGQGIRQAGSCPKQPLYHYEFADSGGHWVARHASAIPPTEGSNTDLTPDEQKALDDAIKGATSGNPRCLTPAGNAKTLDAGR